MTERELKKRLIRVYQRLEALETENDLLKEALIEVADAAIRGWTVSRILNRSPRKPVERR